MNVIIVSYSFTGNNEALAASVAGALAAEHIRLSERKPRTMGAIAMDMLFNRAPRVEPAPKPWPPQATILFFGPVWMGHVAAPLRAYLKQLRAHPSRYGFISISGGADGANPKLWSDCRKRTGADPALLLDLHIADLLPKGQGSTVRKETSAYRLSAGDIERLTLAVVQRLRDAKIV